MTPSDSPILHAGRLQTQIENSARSGGNARLRMDAARVAAKQAEEDRKQALQDQATGAKGAEKRLAEATQRLTHARREEAEAQEAHEAAHAARTRCHEELRRVQIENWDVFADVAKSAVADYERARERYLAAADELHSAWREAEAWWRSFAAATTAYISEQDPANRSSAPQWANLPKYPLDPNQYFGTMSAVLSAIRDRLPQPQFLSHPHWQERDDDVQVFPSRNERYVETAPR